MLNTVFFLTTVAQNGSVLIDTPSYGKTLQTVKAAESMKSIRLVCRSKLRRGAAVYDVFETFVRKVSYITNNVSWPIALVYITYGTNRKQKKVILFNLQLYSRSQSFVCRKVYLYVFLPSPHGKHLTRVPDIQNTSRYHPSTSHPVRVRQPITQGILSKRRFSTDG